MKKTILTFFALVVVLALSAQAKISIYFNSHNEDNIGYLNGSGGYVNYIQTREALVQYATLTHQKGAKQNWGADHVALRAIAKYDTGTTVANTNGKNLVKWMTEDMGVKCDPHSHENTYNYGDVAYFMSQLGVTPSGTVSGFLYNQLQNGNNWEDYQDGIQGDSFPAYTWYPEILWGGGTPNHVADLNYYGVYKIKSMAEPQTHEPTNHLTLCGTGCSMKMDDTSTIAWNMSIIHRLVDAVENGTLPADGIYPQEIMCTEGKMKQAYFLPLVSEMIDSVNVLVAAGKVQWKTITEIVDYWNTDYNKVPFAVDCDYNTVIGLPTSIAEEPALSQFSVHPNPTNNELHLEVLPEMIGKEMSIADMGGKTVLAQTIPAMQLTANVSALANGVYFVKVGTTVKKVVKQ
jgi:hypothetical protein